MGMTPAEAGALFVALALLAALPSLSVLTVVLRAATHGRAQGVATAAGIVAGDMVWLAVALAGLALLARLPSGVLLALQLMAALWLLWLARALWRRAGPHATAVATDGDSLCAGFMAGLLLTLADHKAALFYLGFLPAFVDLATLGMADVLLILLLTLLAVGGVKLAYALAAAPLGRLLQGRAASRLSQLAAGLLGAAALLLLWRAGAGLGA